MIDHEVPEARASPQELFETALANQRAGRLAAAERFYRQVLAAEPCHADSLHLLGTTLGLAGRHDEAIDLIIRAIGIDPNSALYYTNLGSICRLAGRLADAANCHRRSLQLNPNYPEAYNGLGVVRQLQGRLDEAVSCHRRALDLRPDFADAHINLGSALQLQGLLDEAIICFHQAIGLNAQLPDARNNLGLLLHEQGRLDEAMTYYRRAIGLRPDYPEAHTNLAMLLLARGEFAAGWQEYEWRWQIPDTNRRRRDFDQPRWRGEAAAGRTLLIHAEQGLGDSLQFCRYATLAAARGLQVIVQVPGPLVRLLRGLAGADLVVTDGEDPPAFDLQCPMLSLPLAMGTTLETIPGATPYLHADTAQAASWRARLNAMGQTGPRIGLAWAGNPRLHYPYQQGPALDRRRSMAPERLAPLFEVPGMRFFSLQKGGPAAPSDFELNDFMGEMTDFADTAALVANLDLVISVDTAVAHLAAAMGKPVWVLDRFDACWRWLAGRNDSPWYPTVRLFRQPRPNDWDAVVDGVADALRYSESLPFRIGGLASYA